MKIKYALLAAVVIVGFMACQKDPDPNILNGPTNSCQLIKALYYDSVGAVFDTAGFIYSGSQVTRVNYTNSFYKLDYTNGKVSKRSAYAWDKPDSSFLFDQFTYNSDGTLALEQDYVLLPPLPAPYLYASYTYTYSGGKLSQWVSRFDTSGTGVLAAIYQSKYTYTGNNINQSINVELDNGFADTLNYTYDSKPNYYKNNPVLFFTDANFAGGIPGEFIPLFMSTNNVIGVGFGGLNNNIVYVTDSKQNFAELDINGTKLSSYFYKCQ